MALRPDLWQKSEGTIDFKLLACPCMHLCRVLDTESVSFKKNPKKRCPALLLERGREMRWEEVEKCHISSF